jgi:hypothetical protein
MIQDKSIAAEVVEQLKQTAESLNESVRFVQDRLPPDEAIAYKRATGAILGAIYFEVLAPILREHPDLTPWEDSKSEPK